AGGTSWGSGWWRPSLGLRVLLPFSRSSVACRQGNIKHRSVIHVRLRPKSARMGLDDRPANRQSHSHPIFFRCEEGLEDTVDVFGSMPVPESSIDTSMSLAGLNFDVSSKTRSRSCTW